jgi:hypothetical protein
VRKFKVGDRVRIVGRASDGPQASKWIGRIGTIDRVFPASGSRPRMWRHGQTIYHLDIAPDERALPGKHLRLAGDGDEPAKWAGCVWQPNRVTE